MKEKKLLAKTLPVLFGFFVMGFCDIVGISSDYAGLIGGLLVIVAEIAYLTYCAYFVKTV